jgi:hypothetical protein
VVHPQLGPEMGNPAIVSMNDEKPGKKTVLYILNMHNISNMNKNILDA